MSIHQMLGCLYTNREGPAEMTATTWTEGPFGGMPVDDDHGFPLAGEQATTAPVVEVVTPDPADVRHAEKAAQAVVDGAVLPLAGSLYAAVSSDGTRTYAVNAVTKTCTCPAGQHGRRCYHVGAVLLIASRPADHRPLVARYGRHAGIHPSIVAAAPVWPATDTDNADDEEGDDERGFDPRDDEPADLDR